MSFKQIVGAWVLGAALMAAQQAAAGFDEGVAALQLKQYAVALDEWQKSAEAGDAKSQYGLGYLYQFGLGTEPDNTQAKAWYEKAAAQNDPDALYALGLMYELGSAGKRDRKQAMDLYGKAAASGHSSDADYALGRMYLRGSGVPRDEKQGLDWIAKAASEGQPGAEYLLGEAYEVGGTFKQDKILAYYWYSGALAGDEVVLRTTDPEFNPKAALAVLETHMTHTEIEAAKAKLKKTPPPAPGLPAAPAPTPAPASTPAPAATAPAKAG